MTKTNALYENVLTKGECMWYERERDKSGPPSPYMGIHTTCHQPINYQLTKGQFIVWHIRPYYDTISHIIEHW